MPHPPHFLLLFSPPDKWSRRRDSRHKTLSQKVQENGCVGLEGRAAPSEALAI